MFTLSTVSYTHLKEGIVCNSPREGVTPYCDLSLNGLTIKEAIAATKKYVKEHNLGQMCIRDRHRLHCITVNNDIYQYFKCFLYQNIYRLLNIGYRGIKKVK